MSDAEFAIAINPVRLVIGQGDIGSTQKIDVVNHGSVPMVVNVQKREFLQATDGTLAYQDTATPYSAAGWITLEPENFTVPSGQAQSVMATITAPDVVEPGDHQLALAFVVPSGETTGNIKINRGIAVPVFITAPGAVDTSATLSGLSAPSFTVGGPVPITASVQNVGTVHRDFRAPASLVVDAAGSPLLFPDFTVTRGATRNVSTNWDPPLMCICHPSVTFVNADGSVQSATVRVIVFPLHFVGLILVVVAAGIFVLWFSRRRYRMSVELAAAARTTAARNNGA